MYIPSFDDFDIDEILNKLIKYKIECYVPAPAVYTVNETTAHKEYSKFIDGSPVKSKRENRRETSVNSNPISFDASGSPIITSGNDRVHCRLSLLKLIDIAAAGYSIHIPNRGKIKHIVDATNDALNAIENFITNHRDLDTTREVKIYEEIENFYTTVLNTASTKLNAELKNGGVNIIGLGNSIAKHGNFNNEFDTDFSDFK